MDESSQIKQLFEKTFQRWHIPYPEEDAGMKKAGAIQKGGWQIHYLFGVENGIEYIEYFASHRMTNDRLVRLYADGREVLINAVREFYIAGDEKDGLELLQHNRAFYEEVKKKGLF